LISFHSVGRSHIHDADLNINPLPSEVRSGVVTWSEFPKEGFQGKEVLKGYDRYSIQIYFGSNGILGFPMTLCNKH
jgi:hypothetical protein